jgi:hypothetical protein
MADESKRAWRVAASQSQFAALSADPRFNAVLTLGRIANSIRFAVAAAEDQRGHESPAATRQHTSSFLYLCAVLFEALEFIKRSGKDFKALTAYREGLGALAAEQSVRDLQSTILRPLRNQAIYHHDDHVMPEGIKGFRYEQYVIASGQGTRLFDVFYELSDIAVIGFGLKDLQSPPRTQGELRPVLEKVLAVAHRCMLGIDSLALELLSELGLTVTFDDETPPAT